MLAPLVALAVLTAVAAPERPREVWAFRSVLDERPRILTLALHRNLWVAYDATECNLYRAWTGGVNFDGAVYTTVHGPQPTSTGDLHLPGIVDRPVWRVQEGGTARAVRPEFKGYRFEGGGVTLMYRLRLPQAEVWVYERPEARENESGRLFLQRSFRVEGLPAGMQIGFDALAPAPERGFLSTNGRWAPGAAEVVGGQEFPGGTVWLRRGATEVTASFLPGPEADEAPPPLPVVAPREPGAALRVYWIGRAMSAIPRLIPGQTPNYSVVIPTIDLDSPDDFGMSGTPDQFYAEVTGFINVTEPGAHTFRLTSDDGSRLRVRDEVVVDHDGLHSAEPKDGTVHLAAGEHPFEIAYFDNTVDEALRLEWRRPGQTAFELVPTGALTTQAGEVRVTSPGQKAVIDPRNRWRPGDGLPLEGVHPSFDLATVRPADFRPRVGGMDFLPDGRLVVCTWDPDGAVYVLEGVQAPTPDDIKVTRFAVGLAEPLGLRVVGGDVYVLQKQELTRLRDLDGDGVADEYYAVANGWGVTANFHEFAFGLEYDEGEFLAALAVAVDPGGRSTRVQNPDRGKVIAIRRDGSFRTVASGLRTPNGIGRGHADEVYVSDNQGDWLPSSKIVHLRQGAFYGSRAVDPVGDRDRPEDPPVVWLPQGEIGNSPSEIAPLDVGPYRDQQLHGDVTHGGVKRVFVEEVGGVLQGTVFRFTQGLEAGVNRLTWGPDGALYVGGIGSTGNWGQEGKERFGLQRLKFNGVPTFEMLAVRAKTNGMEIEFTEPLKAGMGESPADYSVRAWKYVPTVEYGGPKVDERAVRPASVTVSPDRRRAFLELPALEPGLVVYFRLNRGLSSQSDRLLWTTEAWYTLNRIPLRDPGAVAPAPPANTLTDEEKRQGFVSLFDGRDMAAWKGWRRDDVPRGWTVAGGAIGFSPGVEGGDIATREEFGDFELRLQWKVSPGGNSGIFFRASEDFGAPWETGPEMQVLDDDAHQDGLSALTSAGSDYALHARSRDVVRPADEWNDVRIIARGDDVEYWLNGYRVVRYTVNSPEWRGLVAGSKFAGMPEFGQRRVGRIVLQDHGDRVWFRDIRIRRL